MTRTDAREFMMTVAFRMDLTEGFDIDKEKLFLFKHASLPKVIYVCMNITQGLLHDTIWCCIKYSRKPFWI